MLGVTGRREVPGRARDDTAGGGGKCDEGCVRFGRFGKIAYLCYTCYYAQTYYFAFA